MKNIILTILTISIALAVSAQEFDKNLASARSSYTAGDLGNARFAMEQMLSDLDQAIGKEILKMLPTSFGDRTCIVKSDKVTGGSGAATGLFVHRDYSSKDAKGAYVDIMNNSPLITSINTMLTAPIIGGMMRNENQKIIKVQGYKSVLTKNETDQGKIGYELQIPFNNTLLTFKLDDTTESEVTKYAATLPLAKIAEAAQ